MTKTKLKQMTPEQLERLSKIHESLQILTWKLDRLQKEFIEVVEQ